MNPKSLLIGELERLGRLLKTIQHRVSDEDIKKAMTAIETASFFNSLPLNSVSLRRMKDEIDLIKTIFLKYT